METIMKLTKQKMALAQVYVFLLEQIIKFKSKNSQEIGITTETRRVPLVISLTSMPSRISKVYLTLETLLSQSIKPDYITLWLGDDITSVPDSIKRLEPRGIQVFFRKDIGSYKKEIYVLRELPGSILVTADDDIMYPKNWLEKLYKSYLENSKIIPCYSGNLIQFDNQGNLAKYRSWSHPVSTNPSLLLCPFTGAGALYPPGSLHSDVCKEDLFLKLCPNNDDIWMKFMSLLNGTPCKMVNKKATGLFIIIGSQTTNLNKTNNRINEYIQCLAQYYAINKDCFIEN